MICFQTPFLLDCLFSTVRATVGLLRLAVTCLAAVSTAAISAAISTAAALAAILPRCTGFANSNLCTRLELVLSVGHD
jgi:hypothetical protein